MLREAGLSDFDAVAALETQIYNIHLNANPYLFKPRLNIERFREYFEDCVNGVNGKVFLYEEDGKILGYCINKIREFNDHRMFYDMKVLEIDDICVDEKARGRRIGQCLFDRAKAYAEEIGASRLELTVWEFNRKARRFFEKQGMSPRLTRMELLLSQRNE